ncbi:MAG: hypothetical protein ACOZCO_16405 [Bacteroidota bacterium]
MAALGLALAFCILGLGFWMLVYLAGYLIPYWVTMSFFKKEKKD